MLRRMVDHVTRNQISKNHFQQSCRTGSFCGTLNIRGTLQVLLASNSLWLLETFLLEVKWWYGATIHPTSRRINTRITRARKKKEHYCAQTSSYNGTSYFPFFCSGAALDPIMLQMGWSGDWSNFNAGWTFRSRISSFCPTSNSLRSTSMYGGTMLAGQRYLTVLFMVLK